MSETPSIAYGQGTTVVDYRARVRAMWIREGSWSHRFQPLTKRVCALCIGKTNDPQHRG